MPPQRGAPIPWTRHASQWRSNGWNLAALAAFGVAVAPNVPGFLATAFPSTFAGAPEIFRTIYSYAWFVGAFLSVAV